MSRFRDRKGEIRIEGDGRENGYPDAGEKQGKEGALGRFCLGGWLGMKAGKSG